MTDDFSALREEVARAIYDPALAELALEHVFSDPVRLVRVLTNQPCATCGPCTCPRSADVRLTAVGCPIHGAGDEPHPGSLCSACHGSGRLDLVGLLVENGTLEAATAVDAMTGDRRQAFYRTTQDG